MGAKDVVVLETRKTLGGNANWVLGCMGIESPIQKYLGIVCRRDDVFNGLMNYAHWKSNAALVRALVDKTATLIQWLEGKGVEWGRCLSHYPGTTPPQGSPLYQRDSLNGQHNHEGTGQKL